MRLLYGAPPGRARRAERQAKESAENFVASLKKEDAVPRLDGEATAYEHAAQLVKERAGREFAAGRDELAKLLRQAAEELAQLGQAKRLEQARHEPGAVR